MMTKRDAALIVGALILAGAGMLIVRLTNHTAGSAVCITVDGTEYGTWPLSEDAEIPIDTDYGHNLLVISDGTAHMEEADCPDGYCMEQTAIDAGGGSIICLPHKLVAEVVGSEEDAKATAQPDAISQ